MQRVQGRPKRSAIKKSREASCSKIGKDHSGRKKSCEVGKKKKGKWRGGGFAFEGKYISLEGTIESTGCATETHGRCNDWNAKAQSR